MLKYRSINEVNEDDCPFYTVDTKDKPQCFVKYVSNMNVVASLIDANVELSSNDWNYDCKGQLDKCVFLELLYNMEDTETEDEKQEIYADPAVEEWSPFDEDDGKEESEELDGEEEESEEDNSELEEEQIEEQVEEEIRNIKVSINSVPSAYIVKADVLVYPTNANLYIDDPELNRRSRFRVQKECQALMEQYLDKGINVTPGEVFITSNGGNFAGGVVAKSIYHAVVSGVSRLVSHKIDKATTKALMKADANKAKVVLFMPFDCGTIPVDEAARCMLSAINNWIKKGKSQSIEKIHIVIPDDSEDSAESMEIFKNYFDRIFD